MIVLAVISSLLTAVPWYNFGKTRRRLISLKKHLPVTFEAFGARIRAFQKTCIRKFVWKILTILLHRYRVFDYYGKLGRYCTFCRGGIFEKRESELSSRFRASTVPHRRYRLEPVFRTKLCKTGTQQVPSRVPRYYYILVSKGSGIGVFSAHL